MKISYDNIGNRTRDLPDFSAVSQTATTPLPPHPILGCVFCPIFHTRMSWVRICTEVWTDMYVCVLYRNLHCDGFICSKKRVEEDGKRDIKMTNSLSLTHHVLLCARLHVSVLSDHHQALLWIKYKKMGKESHWVRPTCKV